MWRNRMSAVIYYFWKKMRLAGAGDIYSQENGETIINPVQYTFDISVVDQDLVQPV